MPDESTDTALDDELTSLSPQERAQVEQMAQLQQVMMTPVPLPTSWSAEGVDTNQGRGVIVSVVTPAGSIRVVLPAEGALRFASEVKKAANGGSGLITPPSGLVVPR